MVFQLHRATRCYYSVLSGKIHPLRPDDPPCEEGFVYKFAYIEPTVHQ